MKKYIYNRVRGTISIYVCESSSGVFKYRGHVNPLNPNDSRIPAEVATVLKVRLRLGEYRPAVIVDDGGNILVEPA
jgi:hypothetical protein